MVKGEKPKDKEIINSRMRISQNERGLVINERGFMAAGIINVVFGIILTLLALRLVLRLLGANRESGFVDFIYSTSQPLVGPFFGVFDTQARLSGSGLEVATLIALLVYGLIGGVLMRVLMPRRA